MENQHQSIDEIFRQSLGDYRETPPAAAWDQVVARLDNDEGQKPRTLFSRWPWIILSLLVVISGVWIMVALYGKGADIDRQSAVQENEAIESPSPTTALSTTTVTANNTAAPGSETYAAIQQPVEKSAQADSGISGSSGTTLSPGTIPSATASQGSRRVGAISNTKPSTNTATSIKQQVTRSTAEKKEEPGNGAGTTNGIANAASPNAGTVKNMQRPNTGTETKGSVEVELPDMPVAGKGKAISSKGSDRHEVKITNTPAAAIPEKSDTQPGVTSGSTVKSSKVEKNATAEKTVAVKSLPEKLATAPTPSDKTPRPAEPQRQQTKLTQPDTLYQPQVNASAVEKKTINSEEGREQKAAAAPAAIASTRSTPLAVAKRIPDVSAASGKALPELDKVKAGSETEATIGAAVPTPDSTQTPTKTKRPPSFSLAANVGWEAGMATSAANRVTGAIRLLWHLNDRMAIGLQPAVRFGSASQALLSMPKSYQQSTIEVEEFTTLDNSPTLIPSIDTIYNYVIRERFDSISVGGRSVGGRFWELELPLIASYQLGRAWRIYGGPSLNFGGRLSTSDAAIQRFTSNRQDSLAQSVRIPSSEFVNYFGKSSLEPYGNYQPTADELQDPSPVRFGYLLGLGYEWKRLMIDASLHQQLTGYEDVALPAQQIYSSPYMRISFGYILFPKKDTRQRIEE